MFPLILAALSAASQVAKQKQAQKLQETTGNIRAAEEKYSPWTGRGPSTQIQFANNNPWDVIGAGASGYALGQGFNGPTGVSNAPKAALSEAGGALGMPQQYASFMQGQQPQMQSPWDYYNKNK